jgi:hypothetical protein
MEPFKEIIPFIPSIQLYLLLLLPLAKVKLDLQDAIQYHYHSTFKEVFLD